MAIRDLKRRIGPGDLSGIRDVSKLEQKMDVPGCQGCAIGQRKCGCVSEYIPMIAVEARLDPA